MKTEKWIIFTEWGRNAIPYILELPSNLNSDEIHLCVIHQLYK